jgi:hypothetical protein
MPGHSGLCLRTALRQGRRAIWASDTTRLVRGHNLFPVLSHSLRVE